MALERMIDLKVSQDLLGGKDPLVVKTDFSRRSNSWAVDGRNIAGENVPHLEEIDGVPSLFIGRKSKNYLPGGFAAFDAMPSEWNRFDLRLEDAGMAFGKASLRACAQKNELRLILPPIQVEPFDDASQSGTGYLSVLYLFSLHIKGRGNAVLRLKNLRRENEAVERTIRLNDAWQRPCVALDGVFERRELQAELVLLPGAECWIDGLLLEPHVVTYRSKHRASLFPAPSRWIPGGLDRAADHLELLLSDAGLPASGMIDFWFRPIWSSLHPQHCFFQMCHDYFGFAIGSAAPLFHAGQKGCPWMYYWEWGLGQGYAADTWHHYALVWKKEGGASIYLDGQSRAHVEQIPAHALKPELAGKLLSIGSSVDGMMCLDHNVPSEIDAYLATWRLNAGDATAADVLLSMEDSSPFADTGTLPARAVFLTDNGRHLIEQAKDHCWFVHNLSFRDAVLCTGVTHGDDHTYNSTMRYHNTSTSADASNPQNIRTWLESRDGGKTWKPGKQNKAESCMLPNGCGLSFSWLLDPVTCKKQMELSHPDGRTETIDCTFDFAEFGNELNGVWGHDAARVCINTVLPLQEGGFLLFAYGIWKKEGDHSVIVFRSDDLRRWTAIARPYRPEGGIHFNETAAVQLESGRILILMRTGGWNQMLAKGVSDDGGRTWSLAAPSGLCGIQPRLKLLHDGTLVLVTGRPGITLALSADGGETFSTIACAEDCRIHEFSDEFGWYGYSSMNSGLAIDEANRKVYLSYDMLNFQLPGGAPGLNACFIKEYELKTFPSYKDALQSQIPISSSSLLFSGAWKGERLRVTAESGASVEGEFEGTGLVVLFEKSIHSGNAVIHIDGKLERKLPLYLPYRILQRELLAHDLPRGRHKFKISLEMGSDPDHKFANPEMPALGGQQTSFLAGLSPARRMAVYSFEVLA
ncbi:MAG: hypothetical protein A2X49_08800 [Lentisphaerae bacterium GWF2_52_8]|nr:MAG: hypothetical protein A2X49_08800 [Lentisphaerae bacterium GWF2_52_8]